VNKTTAQSISTSQQKLAAVTARLQQAVEKRRSTGPAVQLLAVSKTFPAQAVIDFVHCGQRIFGENYVQEACDKIIQCRELLANENNDAQLEWHFIGPLQSNKTRQVAEHFDWVQSVDRLKIAQRLNEQRPDHLGPLNVCIQVNVSGEASKSGCAPQDALALADQITLLPRLKLRGLMAIPEAIIQDQDQTNNLPTLASQFALMQTLFNQLKEHKQLDQFKQASIGKRIPTAVDLNLTGRPENTKESVQIDTLSLGMSADLELAVNAGSTMVRIGSALFGQRSTHV
jgi:PLP dependent protein